MSDITAHLGKKNETIERLMMENVRLRAAWDLAEDAARLLLRTGDIDQDFRDRALTMLDRARAGASDCEASDGGSKNG